MTHTSPPPDARHRPRRPGWDVLLVAVLLFSLLEITGLAEAAALPTRVADVLRHPVLAHLIPAAGMAAFGDAGPASGEPIGLLLNSLALGALILYALTDLASQSRTRTTMKWVLLAAMILCAVYLPAVKLMLLRAQSGPASYSHDGGTIQTEATIDFLLSGRNPYSEDYTATPMAEWGLSKYRTALYHYPYLPWTFLFSAPFALLGHAAGGYDQRIVYLLLMAIALALAPRLAMTPRAKLALVALLALNPIMGLDLIFGQNDAFVLAWILLALVAWRVGEDRRAQGASAMGWRIGAAVLYGLACASKPTAWFLAPFLALLFVCDAPIAETASGVLNALGRGLLRLWPALLVFVLIVAPYAAWDPWALYDDVWRWSSGQGETGYQIWGLGASNFVLAAGWVQDRFQQWPFWLPELIVGLPLLVWFLWRQARDNTLAAACWHYGLFLFAFFYVSRFLNENYLGYVLAFLALGTIAAIQPAQGKTESLARPFGEGAPIEPGS